MQSKEYYRAYYEKNKERILARARLYREQNIEKIRESNKRSWRKYAGKNKEYNRARYIVNKIKIDRLKAESGCKMCGETDIVCLQFHHRDQNLKSTQVGALCGYSWKNIETEIKKCDVLCANCHAIQHYHERRQPPHFRKRRLKQQEFAFGD